jgi:phage terminase large subunit-like protein
LRFEAYSQGLQRRHANLGWTAITFDPYIADMIVRRLYITENAAERE